MEELTIVIPTRNRWRNLERQLRSLQPQLNHRVKVIVIDNDSDASESQAYLNQLRTDFPSVSVTKNRFNIGGDANILRCFELCESEWILPLGDSKLLRNDALEIIFDFISRYNNASFINFHFAAAQHGTISKDTVVKGSDELFEKADSFGNLLLFGNTIYRIGAVKKHMHIAYSMISSHAAHVALMYSILKGHEAYSVLTPKSIINEMADKVVTFDLPSILDCRLNFPLLENLAESSSSAKKISELVSGSGGRPSQPFAWVIYNCLKLYWEGKNDNAKNIYKRIVYLNYRLPAPFKMGFLYFLVDAIILTPFSKSMYKIAIRSLKKRIQESK